MEGVDEDNGGGLVGGGLIGGLMVGLIGGLLDGGFQLFREVHQIRFKFFRV